MIVFQIFLNGKKRVKQNFKTRDNAEIYVDRLRRHIKDRILEGQLGYRRYEKEAKNLKICSVEIEIPRNEIFYSIIEVSGIGQATAINLKNKTDAEDRLKTMTENSNRNYYIMENRIFNG